MKLPEGGIVLAGSLLDWDGRKPPRGGCTPRCRRPSPECRSLAEECWNTLHTCDTDVGCVVVRVLASKILLLSSKIQCSINYDDDLPVGILSRGVNPDKCD